MFPVTIDPDCLVPPYEQLRQGVIAAVRAGKLLAGAQLPTVRGLAVVLGLAPNTVARAYRELEHDGVLETRGRRGSFVASCGDPTIDAAGRAAVDYMVEIRRLGVDDETALGLVRAALQMR